MTNVLPPHTTVFLLNTGKKTQKQVKRQAQIEMNKCAWHSVRQVPNLCFKLPAKIELYPP